MHADPTKKTCKLCCMDIPKAARKCPYCQHFQNRLSMLMFHPAVHIIFALVPMAAMLTAFAVIFDRGEDYHRYKDQITITESQLTFGDTKAGPTVAVLGTIKNNSPIAWREIRFQVDFTDAAGHRADTSQKEEYSYYLPPHQSLAFKLSFRREFPETNYVKHTVRVVSAKDARARW